MNHAFWNPSQKRRPVISKSEESKRRHVLSMSENQQDSGIPEIIRQQRRKQAR